MNLEEPKNITRNALLAFAFGKEVTARRQTPATGPEPLAPSLVSAGRAWDP